jgi:two-component system nitrate/nitrite response regulator NarL
VETDVQDPKPISVLIAVAVRLYREGLCRALGEQKQLRIAGTASTPSEAQEAVRALQPHVVLIDVAVDNALALMRVLRAEQPRSRILALAVQEEISSILDYAEAGAHGFVTANGSMTDLVNAIESTAAGELLCSPRIAADLLRHATQSTRQQPQPLSGRSFTLREQEVLSLLQEGRSNKEIASALHIAEATVKNHVHHLLEKLQVTTRTQAAVASPSQSRATGRSSLSPRAA